VLWQRGELGGSREVRVAISAADNSALSRRVAHDLALGLGNLADANSSAYQIVEAASADFALGAAGSSQDGRDRRDLSLRSANGDILWSTSIERPSAASANLAQQLTIQAQNALSCVAEAARYRRERFQAETLKLYISACATYDTAYRSNLDVSERIARFEQVVAKAPHFEPAWAKLLMSEVGNLQQVDDEAALRRTIGVQVKDARRLGLDFAELYVAQAETLSPGDFVNIFRTYDEGAKRHPDNANIYLARSYRETYVGRMAVAVNDGTRAVQLDPLSAATLQNLVLVNAYSGNTGDAYSELRKAEQLWPDSPSLISARFSLDLRFGDPKEALALLDDPVLRGLLRPIMTPFLRARIDPSAKNVEQVIEQERKVYGQYPGFFAQFVQTLAQFGRKDDVLAVMSNYSGGPYGAGNIVEVLFRPAFKDVWRDPRSMAAAAHLGLLHYWKVSGNWPDFCTDLTLPYDCKKEAAKYPV
jgi:tetratricopeptide (TPR) repeat protein